MKKYRILLFFLCLLIFSIITWFCFYTTKNNTFQKNQSISRKVDNLYIVKNKLRSFNLSTEGKISNGFEQFVFFNVEGKLEAGEIELKPGSKFKFNQLLYKIDTEELFYLICAQKASLAKKILDQMEFIEANFGNEKSKWQLFLNDFSMIKTLPEFPKVDSKEEKLFVIEKDILTEYMNIRSLETKMSDYIFLAPFDGKVTEIITETGSFVNSTTKIAKISKNSDPEVIVPIDISYINECKKAKKVLFKDKMGYEIGTGKMIRTATKIDSKNQTVDVYFSLNTIKKAYFYSGQIVTTEIEFENPLSCCIVPKNCVKNEKITVFDDNKIVKRKIVIIDSKSDSLLVYGLKNGDKVVF